MTIYKDLMDKVRQARQLVDTMRALGKRCHGPDVCVPGNTILKKAVDLQVLAGPEYAGLRAELLRLDSPDTVGSEVFGGREVRDPNQIVFTRIVCELFPDFMRGKEALSCELGLWSAWVEVTGLLADKLAGEILRLAAAAPVTGQDTRGTVRRLASAAGQPSVSRWIDRLLNVVNAFVAAAAAVTEKADDLPTTSRRLADAYEAFHRERNTMVALTPCLPDLGCAGEAALIGSIYEQVDDYLSRLFYIDERNSSREASILLEPLRELQQAVLKARDAVKLKAHEAAAQKQAKRKRKDDAYVSLNAAEAARFIKTSSKTITTWIGEGTLQTYGKIGTRYKFLRSELDAKKAAYKPRKSSKTGD